ncbi:MAG: glycoside hydrolase family 3 protein [Gammaproteobacteria bacterium]|nr:MAG: glycoside hydrolase family 3 protein [Gammaproteobacteria bacterium]
MTHFLKRHLQLLAGLTACAFLLEACEYPAAKTNTAVPVKVSATEGVKHNPSLWPQPVSKVAKDPAVEKKIDALIAKMTIEQKVGQTIQPEIRSISLADIKKYHIGSVLNGGGAFPNNNKLSKAEDWVALADGFYKASMEPAENGVAIPIMWGTDAVHGHNNVVGATLYPHNIALGATHNPELMKKIGAATASEIAVTGIGWSFAPTVAVVRDDRWGRTYESYSENPELVKSYAGKMVEGLQGTANTPDFLSANHVIGTAKHFLGDGGTKGGIDRGNTDISEEELVKIHAQGYVTAIEAGVQTIMASFNSWQGDRMHGHHYLLTDILKNRMGFDGLVVGDWNGHEFVSGCTKNNCAPAFNAGVDIIMVPDDWKLLYENSVAQVKNGVISQSRLDDAVRRILRVKIRAGLFEAGAPSKHALSGKNELLGSAEHRAIARQAVRESLVLLKNKNNLLPIKAGSKILIAGDGADNIGKQAGGWSISWQGTGNVNSDFPGATSIYKGIADAAKANGSKVTLNESGDYTQKPDVAVVVFGENPYAEMQGDINKLDYASDKELKLLQKFKAQGDAKNKARFDFTGKLSFSWPSSPDQTPLNVGQENYAPLFAYGYGLTYADKNTLADDLSESAQTAKKSSETLEVFKSRSIDPWQLTLTDNLNNTKVVTASVVTLGAVNYRAVDRLVQEDSVQLQWSGKAQASAGFIAKERVDSSSLPEKSALVFDVKVDKKPTADVKLSLSCGADCGAEKSITDILQAANPGQWQTVSLSLNCFKKVKLDMLLSPFTLSTAGELNLSLHHIRIEASATPVVSCQ